MYGHKLKSLRTVGILINLLEILFREKKIQINQTTQNKTSLKSYMYEVRYSIVISESKGLSGKLKYIDLFIYILFCTVNGVV